MQKATFVFGAILIQSMHIAASDQSNLYHKFYETNLIDSTNKVTVYGIARDALQEEYSPYPCGPYQKGFKPWICRTQSMGTIPLRSIGSVNVFLGELIPRRWNKDIESHEICEVTDPLLFHKIKKIKSSLERDLLRTAATTIRAQLDDMEREYDQALARGKSFLTPMILCKEEKKGRCEGSCRIYNDESNYYMYKALAAYKDEWHAYKKNQDVIYKKLESLEDPAERQKWDSMWAQQEQMMDEVGFTASSSKTSESTSASSPSSEGN